MCTKMDKCYTYACNLIFVSDGSVYACTEKREYALLKSDERNKISGVPIFVWWWMQLLQKYG